MFEFKRVVGQALFALFSMVITGVIVLAVIYTYMTMQLPNVNTLGDIHLQVPLRIYTADGKLIAQFGSKRRIPVSLDQIPKKLIQAVLATEDARFYEHPGIDFISLLRAARVVIMSGKRSQGASTITMQVARNFFLNPEKTYARKINEMLLALKIDREFSKDKILELYLNKIYFGKRAYGVAAAAEVYFGKNLNQLSLSEMATLAGLPQAPSSNNPITNPLGAEKRRNHVLARMLEMKYITQAEYAIAISEPIVAVYHATLPEVNAPYVAEMVREAMVEEYGQAAYDEGIAVYTTISSNLQQYANEALSQGLIDYDHRHGLYRPLRKTRINFPDDGVIDVHKSKQVQGALVALNPQNGALLALTGGFDYQESSFNRATQAERQPGSSFKPFIYSAALEKGYTLASMINDAPIVLADTGENALWRPMNDTKKFYGPTSLRTALIHSRNLVSIRLLQEIGIQYTLNYLQRFGFDPNTQPNSLSLALGSGSVTPLQLAAAYAIFANGGYRVTPYFIAEVKDQHDKILYQAMPAQACEFCITHATYSAADIPQPSAAQVITPQNAYIMSDALKDVIRRGTANAALNLQRSDLYGKTGTTNNQDDAWFVGYNHHLVATVWVGFDNLKSVKEHGAVAALPIWMQFMKNALNNVPVAPLPEPSGIVRMRIDPTTGLLANPKQDKTALEIFMAQHVPKQITATTNTDATSGTISEPKNGDVGESESLF